MIETRKLKYNKKDTKWTAGFWICGQLRLFAPKNTFNSHAQVGAHRFLAYIWRVNLILAVFGHTGPKMGQSQKNFGIRIKFKLGPNFGFNDKKVSRQRTARKLKKKNLP